MVLNSKDIQSLDKIKRLNLINSLSGIKPANLIGSISEEGLTNLAIFSSVIHLGSHPPLLGMVSRPSAEVPRHTLDNIEKSKFYTINHLHKDYTEQGHYTSAKFDRETSEFEACGFTASYIDGFKAPFVKESLIKIGMSYKTSIPIPLNGTVLIIGEIVLIDMPQALMDDAGMIDLDTAEVAGISGLNSYYSLHKIGTYPYARVGELPDFNKK